VLIITTPRLELRSATESLVHAEIHDRQELARRLGAVVSESWPPPTLIDALPWFLEQMQKRPESDGWFTWYAMRHDLRSPALIASGGFKGPPQGDGTVEIGYSVLSDHQRLGIATEMVRALCLWAFAHTEVAQILAETDCDNVASRRVLEKNGFVPLGAAVDLLEIRFALTRECIK
jgi:RimJ/RimL family protein N-acetyltransferase